MMSDFLAHFLTYLPTPVRFCPNIDFQFHYMVSDFGKSTYLPKNRTSFMDVPLFWLCIGYFLAAEGTLFPLLLSQQYVMNQNKDK